VREDPINAARVRNRFQLLTACALQAIGNGVPQLVGIGRTWPSSSAFFSPAPMRYKPPPLNSSLHGYYGVQRRR
jgi:hypothetical protein